MTVNWLDVAGNSGVLRYHPNLYPKFNSILEILATIPFRILSSRLLPEKYINIQI